MSEAEAGVGAFQLPFRDSIAFSMRDTKFGGLSTPFSGFAVSLPHDEGFERAFNSLFGIQLGKRYVEAMAGWDFQLPFRDSTIDIGAGAVEYYFQLPFRDSVSKTCAFNLAVKLSTPFSGFLHLGVLDHRVEAHFQLPFRDSAVN